MESLLMKPAPQEDNDLVQRCLEGDGEAFEGLVERYSERTFALVRHYARNPVEVEDIVQDTFLKAFRKLDSFQHQSAFSTWLFRIAVNTALDFRKRAGRNPVQTVEDPEVFQGLERRPGGAGPAGGRSSGIAAPDAGLEREEVASITRAVLDELPEIFRTVLVLREFEEMNYQDMADLLGISIGTVESRLFRARARFRQGLSRMHPEYAEEWEA